MYHAAIFISPDTVVSLEQSEYVVYNEHGPLSVTIVMNDITLQDVIVEVTVTDGTAKGKMITTSASDY